ncbi:MAG: preprotein translocase subunit SecG [Candidatus Sumerlaeota bacterium]|nr:preprotein translocase subunit SecG [Candidatus Sumerlaeota bacterium]
MATLLLVILTMGFMFNCMFLVVVVLMQEGKSGGLSGMLSGASPLSDTLGAYGAENTLRKWTKYSAVAFMALAITLTIFGPALLRSGGTFTGQLSTVAPSPTSSTSGTATGAGTENMPEGENPNP